MGKNVFYYDCESCAVAHISWYIDIVFLDGRSRQVSRINRPLVENRENMKQQVKSSSQKA